MLWLFILLSICMVLVVLYDVTRYIIPNWLNGLLLILYPVWIFSTSAAVDWVNGLIGFAAMFLGGLVIFLLRIMGGGDIKLLWVAGLWFGWSSALVQFLVWVAIAGGVLSLLLLGGRPMVTWLVSQKQGSTIPRVLTIGQPVPYGVAIAAAFLGMLWKGMIPSLVL